MADDNSLGTVCALGFYYIRGGVRDGGTPISLPKGGTAIQPRWLSGEISRDYY